MIALISDLHANLEATQRVFEDIAQRGIRDVVCLGDMIGYGANPREVLQLVISHCRLIIRGNHEHALFNTAEGFNERARAALEWTRSQLNAPQYPQEENYRFWQFLDALPQKAQDADILYVHGSPRDPIREYMLPRDIENARKMQEIFNCQDRTVCFVGHSHIPGVYTEKLEFISPTQIAGGYGVSKNAKTLINVGSIGQPRDGDPRLSYVTFDGEKAFFHRLEYDLHKAVEKIRSKDELPDSLADRLLIGR